MSLIKTGLARAGTIVTTIAIGAWALFQQFVFAVGASTVSDDYSQLVNERLPAWTLWLLQTPWWVPSLLAATATAFLIWLSWPANVAAPGNIIANSLLREADADRSRQNSCLTRYNDKSNYLESATIFAGRRDNPPSYRARFARSGRDGAFYLEYSSFSGGYGARWTVRQTKLVHTANRFIEGEDIEISLLGVVETKEGSRWYWQPAEINSAGYPNNMIGINWHYKGRVRFVDSDDREQTCYFIAVTSDHSVMPHVTGEHMFAHAQEWEVKAPHNGD